MSTGASTTVLELADNICKRGVNGWDQPFRYVADDPFDHDVKRRVPATEKAKRILGFEAATPLEQMLDEVIPWIANAIDNGTI